MDSLDTILKIGKVISVKGRQVEVLVDKTKNTSHLLFNGELIKNVSVGSYIKISKGFQEIVGKIDGEFISEDKNFASKEYKRERDKNKRILNISLLGYFDASTFKQGIKELPLIDNECSLLTQNEFDGVHNFIKTINGIKDDEIKIGKLSSEHGVEIKVGVNSLFASHIGIFGNTGSGKSYTLAGLYHNLFKKYGDKQGFKDNARFLFIDFNGEYVKNSENGDVITDAKYKNVYKLSTRKKVKKKFPISEDEIRDVDFWAIFLTATEKTQTPFLKRALVNDFYFSRFNNTLDFKFSVSHILKSLILKKVEKGDLIQFLREMNNAISGKSDVQALIDDYQNHLKWHSRDNKFYFDNSTVTIYDNETNFENNVIVDKVDELTFVVSDFTYFEKIRLRIIFQYYNELAKFDLNSEHISPLIKRLKTIEDLDKVLIISEPPNDRPLSIISLVDVNTTMKKILPLLICKQVYSQQKQLQNKEKYLNIIIDEAHNILSYNSERESVTWKDYRLETFEEIIKEGRKFGVFLTLASQRPSDISSTILSQLHNYFLHRLINNRDIEAVERTISYLDKVSVETLSILPTGTCVLAGLSAQVPVIIEIDEIEKGFEPNNKTIRPTDFWK